MKRNAIRRVICGVLALSLAFATPAVSFAKVTKQESVYVIANPDGSTKSITVSDQLQGAANESGTIKDVSELSDIKNVKGDETFDQSGQNLTWNLNGADIFYQGKTDKKLPVSVKITYELDGAKVNPQDIVGKSGKLKITVKYENNEIQTKTENGKSVKIATPFLMATGLILDSEHFTNVKMDDGGKVIDDGSKSIVIGIGMPGLKDSLDLSSDLMKKIDDKLKDEFTVTCDTTEFEMKNTFTFASASLLNMLSEEADKEDSGIDFDKIDDKIDDLDEAVDKLNDGTKKLSDGTKDLDKGVADLKSGIEKYANQGVKKLTAGIRELGKNAPKLKKGVGDYVSGVDKLAEGTKKYVATIELVLKTVKTATADLGSFDATKLAALTTGIEQLSNGLASIADKDKMTQLSDGAKAVSDGIGTVNAGLTQLKSSFSNNENAIVALETALAADEKVLEGLKAAKAAGDTNLDTAIATMEKSVEGQKKAIAGLKEVTKGQKEGVEKLATATASGSDLASGAKTIADSVSAFVTGLTTMADPTTMATLKEAMGKIGKILPSLSGILSMASSDTITNTNKQLTDGCDKLLSAGKKMRSTIKKLGDGMTKLDDGAKQLDSATDTVVNGTGKLKDGTGKLFSGAKKLNDGFTKFREKAIDKLMDFYNDDLKGMVDRLQDIMDAGKEYKSFSGIDDSMDGEVKFIIETEAVKAEE